MSSAATSADTSLVRKGSSSLNTDPGTDGSTSASKVSLSRRSSSSNQDSLLAVSSFVDERSHSSSFDNEDPGGEAETVFQATAQHVVVKRPSQVNYGYVDSHHRHDSSSLNDQRVKENPANRIVVNERPKLSFGSDTAPGTSQSHLRSLPDGLRSHPPSEDDTLGLTLHRSKTTPSKRKTSFSPEGLGIDASIARKWRGDVIGTPYPHDSQPAQKQPNSRPEVNTGKRNGRIWDRVTGESAQKSETGLHNVVRGSDASISKRPDANESSAPREALRGSAHNQRADKRERVNALEPGIRKTSGAWKTSNKGQAESILTVVVRHPITNIPKSKTIAIPTAKDVDDQRLALAIRACYDSLRGMLRSWLSARTLAQVITFVTTSEIERLNLSDTGIETHEIPHGNSRIASLLLQPHHKPQEMFGGAYVTALVLNPALGKGSTKLISWAKHRDRNEKPTKREGKRKVIDNMLVIENSLDVNGTANSFKILEVKEGWAIARILCVVLAVVLLSILSVLLWVFLGPNGTRSMVSSDVTPVATAIESGNNHSATTSSYSSTPTAENLATALATPILENPSESSGSAWESTVPSAPLPSSVAIEGGGVPELASEIFTALATTTENLPAVTPGPWETLPVIENFLDARMTSLLSAPRGKFEETGNTIDSDVDSSESSFATGTSMYRRVHRRKPIRQSPERTAQEQTVDGVSGVDSTGPDTNMDVEREWARGSKVDRIAGALALGLWVLAAGMLLVGGWLGISWIAG